MASENQRVFLARTGEEGLRRLNELKGGLKVSWDDLVIEAVCDRYGLDRGVMALPKKEKPAEEAPEKTATEAASDTGKTKRKSKKG